MPAKNYMLSTHPIDLHHTLGINQASATPQLYMQSIHAHYSGSNATFGFGADSVLTFGFGADFGAAWETPNYSN